MTNLDREHMDCYRDMEDVEDAFVEFMDRVPFYGATTVCLDNEELKSVLPRVHRRFFTYGQSPAADFVVRLLPAGQVGSGALPAVRSRFEVVNGPTVMGPFSLQVPGLHNVLNATAAVAVAVQLEVETTQIIEGLRNFRGVDRRFQVKGIVGGITVIDDYGHHPTEIRATLAAARSCGFRRLHVIFQPHRYTRTRDLLADFVAAFAEADTAQILDIYAASEEPIPGIHTPALVAAIHRADVRYSSSFAAAAELAAAEAEDGDAIITLGAGSVSQVSAQVLEELRRHATISPEMAPVTRLA